MLVKQSFRVHQIIPHIAKKEKRLYLFNLQKLIVLHFDDNNQKENLFGVNQDFTINKLIMQIKVLTLFLFTTGTLKGYNAQVFGLCSSIAGKNYTTCFLNYTPKQKRSYLDEFTLSLVDDCSDCHRYWVLHSFYLWPVFWPCFFHSLFSHSQYLHPNFIPLLQCSRLILYYHVVFHLLCGCFECSYNRNIETLT